MDKQIEFLNLVKEYRVAKGLSQAELAEAVGVSRNTISSIETGQYSPTAKLAYALCLVLEKSFEEVFYFEGAEPDVMRGLCARKQTEANEEGEGIPDKTLNRLMKYLTQKGWSAVEILDLIHFLTKE